MLGLFSALENSAAHKLGWLQSHPQFLRFFGFLTSANGPVLQIQPNIWFSLPASRTRREIFSSGKCLLEICVWCSTISLMGLEQFPCFESREISFKSAAWWEADLHEIFPPILTVCGNSLPLSRSSFILLTCLFLSCWGKKPWTVLKFLMPPWCLLMPHLKFMNHKDCKTQIICCATTIISLSASGSFPISTVSKKQNLTSPQLPVPRKPPPRIPVTRSAGPPQNHLYLPGPETPYP